MEGLLLCYKGIISKPNIALDIPPFLLPHFSICIITPTVQMVEVVLSGFFWIGGIRGERIGVWNVKVGTALWGWKSVCHIMEKSSW